MPLDRRIEAVSSLIRLGWRPPPLSREQSLRLLDTIVHTHHGTIGLSPSELRLLTHLANGETVVSAAERMKLSPHTTRYVAKVIRRKLGVSTMMHAIALVVDQSLVEVERD